MNLKSFFLFLIFFLVFLGKGGNSVNNAHEPCNKPHFLNRLVFFNFCLYFLNFFAGIFINNSPFQKHCIKITKWLKSFTSFWIKYFQFCNVSVVTGCTTNNNSNIPAGDKFQGYKFLIKVKKLKIKNSIFPFKPLFSDIHKTVQQY